MRDSFCATGRVVPLRNPARRAVVRRSGGPESVRPGALPVLVVAAAVLGFEIAYGAAPGDAVLYLAYEAGFVVIPGWLAYSCPDPPSRGPPLRQLAMGWALGYVLEILAFMLTASVAARGLFLAYPLVVGLPALAVMPPRPPAVPLDSALPPRSLRGCWRPSVLLRSPTSAWRTSRPRRSRARRA